jgi:transcriptional repressor NrdR
VTAEAVGQKVVKELRLVDDVAYVRFASVYQTFKDISEFVEHLEDQHEENTRSENSLGIDGGVA